MTSLFQCTGFSVSFAANTQAGHHLSGDQKERHLVFEEGDLMDVDGKLILFMQADVIPASKSCITPLKTGNDARSIYIP